MLMLQIRFRVKYLFDICVTKMILQCVLIPSLQTLSRSTRALIGPSLRQVTAKTRFN